MALANSSSLVAWTLASVRSLISSFLPILVSPLPSAPWHLAQSFSQISLASPARAVRAPAASRARLSTTSFFICLSFAVRLRSTDLTIFYDFDSAPGPTGLRTHRTHFAASWLKNDWCGLLQLPQNCNLFALFCLEVIHPELSELNQT